MASISQIKEDTFEASVTSQADMDRVIDFVEKCSSYREKGYVLVNIRNYSVLEEHENLVIVNDFLRDSAKYKPVIQVHAMLPDGQNFFLTSHVPARNSPLKKQSLDYLKSLSSYNKMQERLEVTTPDRMCQTLDEFLTKVKNLQDENDGHVVYGSGISLKGEKHLKIGCDFRIKKWRNAVQDIEELGEGISSPFAYLGTKFSAFQLHREDFGLASLNMHLSGSSKVWFVIPPSFYTKVRELIGQLEGYPLNTQKCSAVLTHKDLFIDPNWLIGCGVPLTPVSQNRGQMMVLHPFAVHEGLNVGPNLAEAINFVTKQWIPAGICVSTCRCNDRNAVLHLNLTKAIQKLLPSLEDTYIKNPRSAFIIPFAPFMPPFPPRQEVTVIGLDGQARPSIVPEAVYNELLQSSSVIPNKSDAGTTSSIEENVQEESEIEEDMEKASSHGAESELEGEEATASSECKARMDLHCPDCDYVVKGGVRNLDRLVNHAQQWHMTRHPTIVQDIKRKYTKRVPQNVLGQYCDFCGKFIRNQTGNLYRHIRNQHQQAV